MFEFKTSNGDKTYCRGFVDINSAFVGLDHIFIGYIDCSHFKRCLDDNMTGSFLFLCQNYRVKSCGLSLVCVETTVSQPVSYVDGTSAEVFAETIEEQHTETREFKNKIDDSGSTSSICCDDDEMDIQP